MCGSSSHRRYRLFAVTSVRTAMQRTSCSLERTVWAPGPRLRPSLRHDPVLLRSWGRAEGVNAASALKRGVHHMRGVESIAWQSVLACVCVSRLVRVVCRRHRFSREPDLTISLMSSSSEPRSRLDRLLRLLHTGNDASRVAAAKQLGQIQREHPRNLHALLQRVLTFLFSDEWDTRRAAALALENIAAAVPTWQPLHPLDADADAESAARKQAAGAWLAFESFQMDVVLRHGQPLLASGGQEFEVARGSLENPRERLLKQRKILQEQLGLDSIETAMGVGQKRKGAAMVDDLVGESDLIESGSGSGAADAGATKKNTSGQYARGRRRRRPRGQAGERERRRAFRDHGLSSRGERGETQGKAGREARLDRADRRDGGARRCRSGRRPAASETRARIRHGGAAPRASDGGRRRRRGGGGGGGGRRQRRVGVGGAVAV